MSPRWDGSLEDPPVSDGLPALPDPFLSPSLPGPARSELSGLAVTSLVSAFIGPVGAICAIVFGWIARREIAGSRGGRTGMGLATAGLVLGVLFTMAWGAGLGLLVWERRAVTSAAVDVPAASGPSEPAREGPEPATPAPSSASSEPPTGGVPKSTKLTREGTIALVEVGVDVSSLQDELARQRAEAASAGETMLVWTSRDPCEPCQGVEASLKDPLMQTALAKVRLVKVDVQVFRDDLDALHIPRSTIPGFFLLSLDLTPRDGIDGGEWDEDIPKNIAPVLGAFVRGKYTTRRQTWRSPPGAGVRL